jgi:hypothetical protein
MLSCQYTVNDTLVTYSHIIAEGKSDIGVGIDLQFNTNPPSTPHSKVRSIFAKSFLDSEVVQDVVGLMICFLYSSMSSLLHAVHLLS